MQKKTQEILDELVEKKLITKEEDLTAGAKTNLIFDYMIQNHAYLLGNDIDTVLPESMFKKGNTFHKLIIKYGPLFLKNPQIIENRYTLIKDDDKVFPNRSRASLKEEVKLPEEPTIFIANHHFKDDVLATLLAAKRRAFILFGSLPQFYGTVDGILAIENGVALVDRKVHESKHASVPKGRYILDHGMDLIIFPEAVWNKKPSGQMLDFYSGFYRTAKKEDGSFSPVVPMVHYIKNTHKKGKDNPIHTIIDDPVYFEGKDYKQEIEMIRETMLTWQYKLMEKYGQTTRKELLDGYSNPTEAWEDELRKRVATADKYDIEIETSADKTNPLDPLSVWEPIANVEITPQNASNIVEAKKLVKELKTNDFQHRF